MEEQQKDKIQCLQCGKFFKRPCAHAWQVHGLSAREYKKKYGLELTKGIITEEEKKILQGHVKRNYNTVVKKTILKSGKSTRFKKGDTRAGAYERSEQTLRRLEEMRWKRLEGIRKRKESVDK